MLSLGRLFQSTWLLYFSKPACDRPLFRAVKGKPIRSVVEIGIPSIARTRRLLDVLSLRGANLPLRYTGIDPFDSRAKGMPRLSLKQTYSELCRDGIQVKLIPGDPQSALARSANTLIGSDLLIVSSGLDAESLAKAWTWMPRMLHAGTIIFQEVADPAGAAKWQRLSIVEIQKRAAATKGKRRAA